MSRILVVDDDAAVRTAIKIVLERDGQQVEVAGSGRAGIAAAKTQKFDIVICDIFMPGMDGIETITEFHQIDPKLPIIAMSGFMFRDGQVPAPDYLTLSTRLGAAYSLRKPFRPQELLEAVQACIGNLAQGRDIKAAG